MKLKAPIALYRHRGYTDEDLNDERARARLIGELSAASQSKVWFSPLGDQNDPFDTNPHFRDSGLKEVKEFMQHFRRVAGPRASFYSTDFVAEAMKLGYKKSQAKKHLKNDKQKIPTVRKLFQDYRKSAPICCFTETITSVLMWSNYSSSHKSFAYEFCLANEALQSGNQVVADVRYLTDRPVLTTVDMLRRMAQQRYSEQFPEATETLERVDNATFLSKSYDWKHERGWRALITPEAGTGFQSIKPYALSSIVFGARATQSLIDFVSSNLIGGIRMKFCKTDSTDYRINVV